MKTHVNIRKWDFLSIMKIDKRNRSQKKISRQDIHKSWKELKRQVFLKI